MSMDIFLFQMQIKIYVLNVSNLLIVACTS